MISFDEIVLWAMYIISLYFSIFWVIVFFSSEEKNEEKQKLKRFPLVSILIPAYNEETTIQTTIKSVLNQNYPKEKIEVIVINDGSTDATEQVVKELIKKNERVKLLNQKNSGKARALNNALAIAKGEFFACLDADSFVERNTLKKMLSHYYSLNDKNLVIVTPSMKAKKPKNLIQKIQRMEYLIALFIAKLMSGIDCIYVAPGPFSLYKTNIIKKLGGFDETSLTEDQEIAYRVQSANYQIKQCHGADVYTAVPKSILKLYRQRNRWFKGGLINIIKYKRILLNKKYGDFGMMQMLMNAFYFIISIGVISFVIQKTIKPLLKRIHNFYITGFDLSHTINVIMDYRLRFIDINIQTAFILVSAFLLSLLIFCLAHKNADESIKKYGVFSIILYFFIYYIGLALVEVIVLLEWAVGKKQKW